MTLTLRQGAAAVVDGAIGGGLATMAMSVVMLGARRVGLVEELPPERMATVALDAAGQRARTGRVREALAVVLHVGFGVATGCFSGSCIAACACPSRPSHRVWSTGASSG